MADLVGRRWLVAVEGWRGEEDTGGGVMVEQVQERAGVPGSEECAQQMGEGLLRWKG